MSARANRGVLLAGAALFSACITAICFVLSDRPDRVYLNPLYVDVVVLVAGVFLMADAFCRRNEGRFPATVLTAMIGAAIVTIHVLQFAFDLIRHRPG